MFVTVAYAAYVSCTDGPCTMLFVFWLESLLYNVDKKCHQPPMTGNGLYIYICIHIPPISTYKNGDDWGIVNMMVYGIMNYQTHGSLNVPIEHHPTIRFH